MTCPICAYWEWRLRDLRLSRDKQHSEALMLDIANVVKAYRTHRLMEHPERFEVTA